MTSALRGGRSKPKDDSKLHDLESDEGYRVKKSQYFADVIYGEFQSMKLKSEIPSFQDVLVICRSIQVLSKTSHVTYFKWYRSHAGVSSKSRRSFRDLRYVRKD